MRKGKPKLQTPGKTNKFEFSPVSPKRKIHPTERPVEMIEDILKTFIKPNQRVFVPFLGSGNTLIAAHNLSMFSMGADLDEKEIFKPAFVRKVMEEI
jgi:site-specific DNA-methyltransferase (adenine-specific)